MSISSVVLLLQDDIAIFKREVAVQNLFLK